MILLLLHVPANRYGVERRNRGHLVQNTMLGEKLGKIRYGNELRY